LHHASVRLHEFQDTRRERAERTGRACAVAGEEIADRLRQRLPPRVEADAQRAFLADGFGEAVGEGGAGSVFATRRGPPVKPKRAFVLSIEQGAYAPRSPKKVRTAALNASGFSMFDRCPAPGM